jgi:elongation factor G
MKILKFEGKNGEEVTQVDLTEQGDQALVERAQKARNALLEQVAEYDEGILEAYLEGKPITYDQLIAAIRRLTIDMKLVPLLCGSSFKKRGVQPILDSVINYLPSPIERPPLEGKNKKGEVVVVKPDEKGPLTALAFKVIHDQHKGLIVYFRVYSGVMKQVSNCLIRN